MGQREGIGSTNGCGSMGWIMMFNSPSVNPASFQSHFGIQLMGIHGVGRSTIPLAAIGCR
ncbi:hypothetical protein ACSBR1_018784 [Camellia fascicularis]